MDKIRALFVLPHHCKNQSEASEVMLQAYESCKQNVVSVSWVEDSKFATFDLSKTDFVIFQEFKGENFESVKETKCARVLGPWCVLVCLMEGRGIPNFTWPIYNVAMSGCVVSTSAISKTKKMQIKEKVQLMGGCYTDSLVSTNTHLITESVKSEKYLQAAEDGAKLMVSKWVDSVWEASQTKNLHCDDEQFHKFKCLPFHNLTISSTGFTSMDLRQEVAQLVVKNGGIFTGNLAVSTTDVLIVHGESGISSKKYKAARANPNIYCVSLDWINQSIEKGYALPLNKYTVNKKGTSTPTKADGAVPDFSMISVINDATAKQISTLEETVIPNKYATVTKKEESTLPGKLQPTVLFPMRISPNKRKCSGSEEIGRLLDGLNIKKAKKAGQYLDGCSVYLAGFKPDQREKLSKILNMSGATRYDEISDRLTHIIVGDATCPEVKIIKTKNYSVSLVSIHWLLESLEIKCVADEENYLINLHDFDKEQFSSPLGRKGLSLLRSNKTMTSNDLEAANTSTSSSQEGEGDQDLMQQYMKPLSKDEDSDTLVQFLKNNKDFNSRPEESKETDMSIENSLQDRTSQDTNVFFSKKFIIVNFPLEYSEWLKQQIENGLGTIMPKAYKGVPDYVVTSPFIRTPIQISAVEIVNHFWITECIDECEELQIYYYHRPIVVTEGKPLENCIVTISGYAAYERNFLKSLIEELGGTFQEQFARIVCAEKNIKASTHLVSLEAEGKKYLAALKWGLPVVSKDWLLECATSGKLEPEEKFLVGDAKALSSTPGPSNDTIKRIITPKRSILTPVSKNQKLSTPLSQMQPLDISRTEKTPLNQRLCEAAAETPCTQVTPINKLMEEVRKTNLLGTPETPPMPKNWYNIDTPESPFGAFIRPHLSAKSKKEIMRYINAIPDLRRPPLKEPKSTPLSEVKRRCWARLLGHNESPSRFPEDQTQASEAQTQASEPETMECRNDSEEEGACGGPNVVSQNTEQNAFIDTKLKQIEEMVSAFGENRRGSRTFQSTVPAEVGNLATKESQPFTVGWDYEDASQPKPQQQVRIFTISGLANEQRQVLVDKIESLGGQVSDLSSYDPKCTHLICPKPARNEKTLSCMASGKWILHTSYVDKCVAAGTFLPEEDFEFGNPKAKENIKETFDKENESRIQSIHWWRKEISRRGYGAFNDMRAIVVAQKREPIVRVIEAGGGQIVNATPPFGDDVHATHCLLEVRCVPDFSVFTPLAQQGILCINTLYISDFLYRTNKDIKDAILPHFASFYH